MESTHRFQLLVLLPLIAVLMSFAGANGQYILGSRKKTDSVPLFRNTHPYNPDSLVEEKLVELALTSPLYDVSGHQIIIAENQLTKAKRTWLNLLSISANYNDQTFAKALPGQNAYVYPKYYFGLTIPIGLFFTMGPDIKSGRENVRISKDNQVQLARTIRAEVLGKYKQYKNYTILIGIQNTVVDDEEALRKQTEKKFKDGSVSIEQYNLFNKLYGDDLTKKLNLQLQQELIKLDIEKMIGVNLETVLKMR
jgi:outer membrane protein TolC